ncbi:hypothetical protein ACFFX1_54825 [Dactylosporangium sucinum]|uniref:Uncharacterized protein n=1 Tax=Dactylosporangium sucinum TaxID=1424081 RepID=A0A917X1S8_9ACTN|nr:hypothetical protein [Dactylosporangium sucinum]GGM53576.1 hypothetical protein GCM10007977_063940 [Dactylosporangium sucinum]
MNPPERFGAIAERILADLVTGQAVQDPWRKPMTTTRPDDELDNLIAQWHAGPGDTELHDWLGVTWDDYRAWGEGRITAADLLARRKEASR